MKIVGECWVETTSEKVLSTRETANTKRRVVEVSHYSVRSLLLECGHTVPVTHFQKVPTTRTECTECELKPRTDAAMSGKEG